MEPLKLAEITLGYMASTHTHTYTCACMRTTNLPNRKVYFSPVLRQVVQAIIMQLYLPL